MTGKDRLITISPASRHYGSPQVYTVKRPPCGWQLFIPMRQIPARDRHGTGILTCFPFERVG